MDEHGIFLVALSAEHDDVVAALKVEERVVAVHFLKRHGCLAVLQLSDEPPVFAFFLKLLAAGLEIMVKCGHFLPELIEAAFENVIGYKEMLLHIALVHLIASLT